MVIFTATCHLSDVLAYFVYSFLVIFSSHLLACICQIGFSFSPSTGFPFPWFISLIFRMLLFLLANHIIPVISVHIGWACKVYNHGSDPQARKSRSTAPRIQPSIRLVPVFHTFPYLWLFFMFPKQICLSLTAGLVLS